jgi:CrcB protein
MTTFSTFSLDALLLFEQGHYNTALFYIVSSVALCLFAAFAGMQVTRVML